MSTQQKHDLFMKVMAGLITVLLTWIGYAYTSIDSKLENTHDSVIRLEERIIMERMQREQWQRHIEFRMNVIEVKMDNNGK